MKDYLTIVPRQLAAHKKRTRLVIGSIAIAILLVTAIFSMLDFFMKFEKLQTIRDHGNYHLVLQDAQDMEKAAIDARLDIANSGTYISFKNGTVQGTPCRIAAMEERFSPNFDLSLLEGKYATADNELMLEEWAARDFGLALGDTVEVVFYDGTKRQYVLSGVFKDVGNTKASGKPGVMLSIAAAGMLDVEKANDYMITFKDGVQVNRAQAEIESSLNLAEGRMGRNEYLLAAIGQSTDNRALGIYGTGAILFVIVLAAGVMMITNTFNISVMERVRQFGLLRCIGASGQQIKRIVRREALLLYLRACPIGVAAGILIAVLCSAILKYFNGNFFGNMTVFDVSPAGIAAGAAVGLLTVLMASYLPAKKAARVSPVNAVSGSMDIKTSKKQKEGWLTKRLRVENAIGIGNAFQRKKTLMLMAGSIAISIVMFLGFQVFIDFTYSSMKVTKPYTPDIVLTSDDPAALNGGLADNLRGMEGTDKVYGRMFSDVTATFAADKLTDTYREIVGGIEETPDGLIVPKETSWLISYDANQLAWAKEDLLKGELSEEALNANNGVIAIAFPLRNFISMETTSLEVGDKVYIDTPEGKREMNVMAVLRSVPFSNDEMQMTTFITTEKLYTELTGDSDFDIINIQLDNSKQDAAVDEIKGMLNGRVKLTDQRQRNEENDQTFFTMAVFVYGFVVVIALISVLNIVNTMNTSVAAKTRYLGVMRAVGMTGKQMHKMVLAEAAAYSITGCVLGCVLGVLLQKALISGLLSGMHIEWEFPGLQILLICAMILFVTMLSTLGPVRRVKEQGIAEVIGAL